VSNKVPHRPIHKLNYAAHI